MTQVFKDRSYQIMFVVMCVAVGIALATTQTARAFSESAPFDVGTSTTTYFIVDGTGNVGIDTASPNTKLNVGAAYSLIDANEMVQINNGGSNAYGTVRSKAVIGGRQNTSTYFAGLLFGSASDTSNGAGVGYLDTRGSGQMTPGGSFTNQVQLSLRTNGTERVRINNSGYVGIGTAAPQALLSLTSSATPDGAGYDSSNNRYVTIQNSTLGGDPRILDMGVVSNTNGTAFIRSVGRNMALVGGYVGIGTASPAAPLDVAGFVKVGSSAAPKGITLHDTANGDPFCVVVTNGALSLSAGDCN